MIVAIDPGLSGACAVRDHAGLRAVFDLPTMPIPGIGPKALVQCKIDGRALCKLLRQHCPATEATPTVVIEQVGTMGGANNAVQTQGSLLRTLGAIETVAECMALPIHYANPKTWKRWYGIGSDKKLALERARLLFPDVAHFFARAKDHNRAEAGLLADWYFRTTQ